MTRLFFGTLALAAAMGIALPATEARAQLTCGEHRHRCELICTPSFAARFHGGSLQRCSASCEPRWQECLRSGVWVDLERFSTGRPEVAPPF